MGALSDQRRRTQPRITRITRIQGRRKYVRTETCCSLFLYPCDPCNPWLLLARCQESIGQQALHHVVEAGAGHVQVVEHLVAQLVLVFLVLAEGSTVAVTQPPRRRTQPLGQEDGQA